MVESDLDRSDWERRIAQAASDARAGRVQTITLAELNAKLSNMRTVAALSPDHIE